MTLSDIIRDLGRDGPEEKRTRSVLSRFLDDPETAALLGASRAARPTFPRSAVPVIAALLEASERGEVTPKMGAIWLTKHFPAVEMDSGSDNSRLTEKHNNREFENYTSVSYPIIESSGTQDLRLLACAMNLMREEMTEFVQAVKDVFPIREDIALTRSQAAALLACAESGVSRLVRPIRRGVYRRSDCLKYLASGVPITSEARRKNLAKAEIPNIRLSENSGLLHPEGQR